MTDLFDLGAGHGAELKDAGARWGGTTWTLPATRMNAAVIDDLHLGLGPFSVNLPSPVAVEEQTLYPYQIDAAQRLAAAPHGLLVCLSPGLGKTAVAVRAAEAVIPVGEKIVVVTLASLLRTWEREILRWQTLPGIVYILEGKPDFDAARDARWIVVSWDKAVREVELWGKGWPLWILDESVLVKSRGSKRFKALRKIRRTVDRLWLLSGNPTTRHADDLWTQLHLIWPSAFPSYWRFAERYCVVEDTQWARIVSADREGRSAAEENSDLVLVVNQEDVLDLPEYLFEPPLEVVLSGRQRAAYDHMAQMFVAELASGGQVVAQNEIARLMQLQRIVSFFDGESAKREALLDVIGQYEPPYLVWTHWRDTAQDLQAALPGSRMVTGETSHVFRDQTIEAFKRGEFSTLILSLGVGKFGHTLTNVKTIFSFDRNFNADDIFQSSHRVRRIGLHHRPVVVPILARGTVDELTVGENLESKLKGISRMTKASLADLLRGIGR